MYCCCSINLPSFSLSNSHRLQKIEIVKILGSTDGLPLAIKCNAQTGELCNEKETTYLTKIKAWTDDKQKSELERLLKVLSDQKSVKPELVHWIQRRTKILEQLTGAEGEKEL